MIIRRLSTQSRNSAPYLSFPQQTIHGDSLTNMLLLKDYDVCILRRNKFVVLQHIIVEIQIRAPLKVPVIARLAFTFLHILTSYVHASNQDPRQNKTFAMFMPVR